MTRFSFARLGRLARYVLVLLFVTFALAEGTARLLTKTAPSGVATFRSVALLPLRPSEALARQAVQKLSQDPFLMRDPDLGWNVRPNKSDDANRTNAQGIRTNPGHLYSVRPPRGTVRIVTLGDSFVYCMQVDNGETWQDYLEEMRPDLEVLNLGLPGGGTDQAYLRWRRDGRPFKSDIVILGIWPDNMLRNLNVVEYYRTQMTLPFTKPRLVLDDAGASKFVNAPIASDEELIGILTSPEGKPLLRHEYWYDGYDTGARPYRRSRAIQFAESVWRRYRRMQTHRKLYSGEIPDGIAVTLAIVKLFVRDVRDAGSIPLVLVIPDRGRLDLDVGEKPLPLVKALREAGIDVIDTGPTFGSEVKREGAARYYVNGVGHHSPFGNRVFARYLEPELRPWIERARETPGR